MRYALLLVLIVMILAALVIPAQAGKPTPYPPPGGGFEIQAYPGPPTPPPNPPAPGFPTDTCTYTTGKPCVWGWFSVANYGPAWWISVDGIGIQPDLPGGIVCAMSNDLSQSYCDTLHFVVYDRTRDRNWYRSDHRPKCGHWFVNYAALNSIVADIRQPNDYLINCVHLPGVPNG